MRTDACCSLLQFWHACAVVPFVFRSCGCVVNTIKTMTVDIQIPLDAPDDARRCAHNIVSRRKGSFRQTVAAQNGQHLVGHVFLRAQLTPDDHERLRRYERRPNLPTAIADLTELGGFVGGNTSFLALHHSAHPHLHRRRGGEPRVAPRGRRLVSGHPRLPRGAGGKGRVECRRIRLQLRPRRGATAPPKSHRLGRHLRRRLV
jgi:hypothetical protein